MRRSWPTLLAALAAFILVSAAPASADVQWRLTSVHGPQNVPPGGSAQYIVQAYNVGDTDTSTSYTITDTLPTEMMATAASGNGWDCSATAFPAHVVTCSGSDTVIAPAAEVEQRGLAPALNIMASAAGDVNGVGLNTATITGGSPTAASASASDPTPFDATPAGFGFVPGSVLADVFDSSPADASPERQAGSHPSELRTDFRMNLKLSSDPPSGTVYTEPDEHVRTVETHLPPGFFGDPQAVPQCDPLLFNRPVVGNFGGCPPSSQVGVVDLILQDGMRIVDPNPVTDVPIFNMNPAPGTLAQFGFAFVNIPVFITVSLDPANGYSVVATVSGTTELQWLRSVDLTLWGVPADPAHDALRFDPDAGSYGHPFTGAPIRPLLTLPSNCTASGAIQLRADSWQHPGAFTPWATGASEQMTGCDDPRFRFEPSITLQPEARTPSTPTGLDVALSVPQQDDTVLDPSRLASDSSADAAIATPPLRDVRVTLPEGMAVSPSAADGLASCSSAQIGLGTDAQPACPDASKIGTAELRTPLLPDPVEGSIYLAAQTDNPFGSLIALYVVLEDKGRGLLIKLPGQVVPDPVTGQLSASFLDNPQLPFSSFKLHFNGGSRAPLVTPATCGTKTTTATLASWNASIAPVAATDSFTISGDGHGAPCPPRGFDPTFAAGTTRPQAGKDSPLVARFGRSDRDQELGKVDVTFARGLLGRIAAVPLCSNANANAGACGAGSRIGRATVAAGPGATPFYITDGRVYLTQPYKGGAFGLSIVVHAKAGPLDLGDVVVRAAIRVDRTTAALRVVTDPLPTILAGIPLQLRLADVTIDRPHFTFNPTSCSPMRSTARITSVDGTVATRTSRFKATGCDALRFAPRIAFRVGSRGHTGNGAVTPLTATVTMPKGDANLRSVSVVLPRIFNARLRAVNAACTLPQFRSGHCSSAAKVGSATAVTPLLRDPLRGVAYFVKNPKRALPDLVVALRGQVDVDLTGKVAVRRHSNRLATSFDTIPDVPITRFTLRLTSGRNGPLGLTGNLCAPQNRRARTALRFEAQNGAVVTRSQRMRVRGCGRVRR